MTPDDSLHIEGFALNVFAKADKQDRADRADKYVNPSCYTHYLESSIYNLILITTFMDWFLLFKLFFSYPFLGCESFCFYKLLILMLWMSTQRFFMSLLHLNINCLFANSFFLSLRLDNWLGSLDWRIKIHLFVQCGCVANQRDRERDIERSLSFTYILIYEGMSIVL